MGETLAPLLGALHDLVAWLQAERVPGIVIGGVAAAILGRPRVTRDVDAVVLLDGERWEQFLAAGRQFGFVPRLSDALAFARQARTLLVRHEPSGIEVDIAFGALPFEEEMVGRAVTVELSGVRLPLPMAEDLLIMKAVARRPRDLADVEAILDVHPEANLRRVRRWLREFAAALDRPAILEDFEAILRRRRRRR